MPAMDRKGLLVLLLSTMAICGAFGQIGVVPTLDKSMRQIEDEKFKPGETWHYRTRKSEEKSTLTVLRVEESAALGEIVHIAVDGIRLKSCRPGYEPHEIPHMPFARKALEESVTKRADEHHKEEPNWKPGYDEWRSAFEQGQAGIYTISVADAISVAEKTYNKGLGCE